MKIETNEKGELIFKEIFNGIGLETPDGDMLGICMRDTGFEFQYHGIWYQAKNGVVMPLGTVIPKTPDWEVKKLRPCKIKGADFDCSSF